MTNWNIVQVYKRKCFKTILCEDWCGEHHMVLRLDHRIHKTKKILRKHCNIMTTVSKSTWSVVSRIISLCGIWWYEMYITPSCMSPLDPWPMYFVWREVEYRQVTNNNKYNELTFCQWTQTPGLFRSAIRVEEWCTKEWNHQRKIVWAGVWMLLTFVLMFIYGRLIWQCRHWLCKWLQLIYTESLIKGKHIDRIH